MNHSFYRRAESDLYVLRNSLGMEAAFTIDAKLKYIKIPDKKGDLFNIVFSCHNKKRYTQLTEQNFGETLDDNKNRTPFKTLTIVDNCYDVNKTSNSIRSTRGGFVSRKLMHLPDKQTTIFIGRLEGRSISNSVIATLKVAYTLTNKNEFENEIQHLPEPNQNVQSNELGIFNINGEGNGSISRHLLLIRADHCIPVDSDRIPLKK